MPADRPPSCPTMQPTWNVQERSCSPSCRSWSTGVWMLMRFSLVSAATGKERTTTCSPTCNRRARSQERGRGWVTVSGSQS